MRRLTATVVALLLGLSLLPSTSMGAPAGAEASAEVRIILSEPDAKRAGLNQRNRLGGKVSTEVTQAQLQGLQKQRISYEILPALSLLPEPGGVATGVKGKGQKRSLPTTQVPWGIKATYGDPELTPTGVSGGSGVIVAVLDTGAIDHPDFYRADGSRVITQCVDFTQKKSPLMEGACLDKHGHGTHVTGILAAAGGRDGQGLFGLAPDAQVYSYKVLTDKGGGYADDIAMGIRTAADRGAQIISMSFGLGTLSPLVSEAIDYAAAKGVLLIAATGNAGPAPATIGYPAALPQVVGVAGLNPDESVMAVSSRGLTDGDAKRISEGEVEVAAPGMAILSTSLKDGYAVWSGTSMAAPHVAGLAAKGWRGSAAKTRQWLVKQAGQHDILVAEGADDAGPGYDIASGYGMAQFRPLTQPTWSDQ